MRCAKCGQKISITETVLKVVSSGAKDLNTIRTRVRKKIKKVTDKEISSAIGKLVQRKRIWRMGYKTYIPKKAA